MKDNITGSRIKHAEAELVRYFAHAEASNTVVTQDYFLNKAIEQENLIKQLKGE